jgi:hypothetical protein
VGCSATKGAALQAAADRLSVAILQRRCNYWVRRVAPVFGPVERAALQPGYRYSMAQMELATDVIFKRSAPLKELFRRACELGVLVGGAERSTHLFGRQINRRYGGKLQTVLDQRDAGHPVLRWYYQTSFAKQYTRGDHHGDRILRTETCSNDARHFGIGRRLENLPLLREKLASTNEESGKHRGRGRVSESMGCTLAGCPACRHRQNPAYTSSVSSSVLSVP